MPHKLSICIPTYNRAEFLKECLESVLYSAKGFENRIEIVVSDNASTDETGNVIRTFQQSNPWIRYHRNEQNIGPERNFYLLATLAKGEFIWIFGDDDKMEGSAIVRVLDNIHAGYDLTICNYSSWDNKFIVRYKKTGLLGEKDQSFENSNVLIKRFGLHLGYISAVVIKRSLFLAQPAEEHEAFVGCGFSFLYSVYAGVAKRACKVGFISEPLVCNRGGNTANYDWYNYFVTGSSLIFNKLLSKGYTQSAVSAAKHQVLRDFVIPHLRYMKLLGNRDSKTNNIAMIFHHYKKNWLFWAVCVPVFFTPPFLARFAKEVLLKIRRFNGVRS